MGEPELDIVVAMDEGGLIGRANGLPWRLPEDMKHFRRLTLGNTVLMGRRTYESLGKPLEGRENWVLSRDPSFAAPGCRVFPSLEAALAAPPSGAPMVIGGAQVYREALPHARRIHLTRVHARLDGDTRFPPLDASMWREVARETHAADTRHVYAYSFITLERAPSPQTPPPQGGRGFDPSPLAGEGGPKGRERGRVPR